MAPILYHIPRTISSPVLQCLLELDVVNDPVEIKEMNFRSIKKPAYLAINPMGTSPAFTDGDIVLYESGAILDYLLERYDHDHSLSPDIVNTESPSRNESASRAKYHQIKQFVLATVYPFMATLFLHTLKPEAEQDAAYVKAGRNKWLHVFGKVLTDALGDKHYFLGDQASAVDFLACKPLNNAYSMGVLEKFPELAALRKRIHARPTYKAAYERLPCLLKNKDSGGDYDRSILMVPSRDPEVDARAARTAK